MFRKILLLYTVPILFAVYYGLGGCRSKVKVCDIHFSAGDSLYGDTTELPSRFLFAIFSDYKDLCFDRQDNPLIASCYARKCLSWQSDLDTSGFRLTFDKDIIAGADTLAAGTDIIKHAVFGKYAPVGGNGGECSSLLYTIGDTSSSVMKKLKFEPGLYTAHFSCTTTDGKEFKKLHYIIFKK